MSEAAPTARPPAVQRVLGALSMVFAVLHLVVDGAGKALIVARGAEDVVTGLPAVVPAGAPPALAAILPEARAAMWPLALALHVAFFAAAIGLLVVGRGLRAGRPWARRAAVGWALGALALLALRGAATAWFVARLRALLGPLVADPHLPASLAPSTQIAATAIALVLFSGWPIVLLVMAGRRRPG